MSTKKELQQRINDYENILIKLHTLRWTGNTEKLVKLLDLIGAFSYARTNSNVWDTDKETKARWEETFTKLKDFV